MVYPSYRKLISLHIPSCGFEIKVKRLQLNLGSLLSSWFVAMPVWGTIAAVIIKRM